MVEMEGYFFILFLVAAFFCGILFIGYFEQSQGITCELSQNYVTGQFALIESKEKLGNDADPSNLEIDSNLEIVTTSLN